VSHTAVLHGLHLIVSSCLIVKTDGYAREQVAKVVQLRANTEGLKLGKDVVDRLAAEGEKSSLR
jgi:RuvB-like protein 1